MGSFNEFLPLILACITGIVWAVRLEGKHNTNAKDIVRLEKEVDSLTIKHESLDSKVVEQLSDVRESLARIEGALGVGAKTK